MINLFQFASNDSSLIYLAKIFGYMNGVIPIPGSDSTTGTGPSITLLGTMFQTFNSVILAVAVLVIVYTTVVGLLNTAHEGQFMGKNWNNLWIPLRMVFGIALLVPTLSGYCILQMVMMWAIVQGVGAADTLWNTVLSYVDFAGSPYAQVTVPSIGYKEALTALFRGLVCAESARQTSGAFNSYPPAGSNYCAMNSRASACAASSAPSNAVSYMDTAGSTSYSLGPYGSCGVLSWCNSQVLSDEEDGYPCSGTDGSTSLACKACKTEITSLKQIYPVLDQVATLFVRYDAQYRGFMMDVYNSQDISVTDPKTNVTTVVKGNGRNVPVPGWVQNYCNDKKINPCTRDFNTGNGLPDPGLTASSAPSDIVKDLYWNYGMSKDPVFQGIDPNFMQTLTAQFGAGINDLFKEMIAEAVQSPSSLENTDLQDAAETGWMTAGSYYYTIAKMNQNNLKDMMPALQVTFRDPGPPNVYGGTMYNYRNNYDAAGSLIGASSPSSSSVEGAASLPSSTSELTALTSSVTMGVQSSTEESLSGDANPLVQAQAAGYSILMIAQIGFFYLLAITFTAALVGNISVYVLGTGVTNPVGPAMQLMFIVVMPAIAALFGIMVSLGATLSVYLPLVPFIIFTFGAIGWLTSTIEAMVAGPLVALGIIAPGGHHELLGKAEPALMLLFNVFLRPSLMIFGLVAAMLLASVVVGMINDAFWRVMVSITGGSSSDSTVGEFATVISPLTMILFLCAYVTLVVAALNKCFAAIHIIPERVMAWVSHQAQGYGEGEALSDIKGGVASGARGAGSAADKSQAAAKEGAGEHRKAKAFEFQEKKEAEKKEGQPSVKGSDGGS
ncbi:MAG TPA: DotA/TraY family protein [Gammaproteobacteria bacterium]|nr:DotA/TraY family protein [Gammaproteobacteria bacterium]